MEEYSCSILCISIAYNLVAINRQDEIINEIQYNSPKRRVRGF